MPKNYTLYLRGYVGSYAFDAEYVNYILDKNKDREVSVLISSLGGLTSVGLSVNSLFKLHGNVHVHFVGANASAATIAAMGAKRVTIDSDAPFLVHKCSSEVFAWQNMNSDELNEYIERLQKQKQDQDTLDDVVAALYSRRCRKSKEDLLALMKTGGWITPQQALEWGFVDEITSYEEDEKPAVTKEMESYFSAEGIPMPPMKRKESFFSRLRALIEREESAAETQQVPAAEYIKLSGNTISSKNNSPMEKFPLISAAVGSEIEAGADAPASMSAALLKPLESALADKDKEIESLRQKISTLESDATASQSKIKDLESTVADLKKNPAEETSDVTESPASADTDGPGDDVDAVVSALAKAYM